MFTISRPAWKMITKERAASPDADYLGMLAWLMDRSAELRTTTRISVCVNGDGEKNILVKSDVPLVACRTIRRPDYVEMTTTGPPEFMAILSEWPWNF